MPNKIDNENYCYIRRGKRKTCLDLLIAILTRNGSFTKSSRTYSLPEHKKPVLDWFLRLSHGIDFWMRRRLTNGIALLLRNSAPTFSISRLAAVR